MYRDASLWCLQDSQLPGTAPCLWAAPVCTPVGSGMAFIWGSCWEEAGCGGSQWVAQRLAGPGRTTGSALVLVHRFWCTGTPWSWSRPQFVKLFPSRDYCSCSADPGVCWPVPTSLEKVATRFCVSLHWRVVLSAGFFGSPQQSPPARDVLGYLKIFNWGSLERPPEWNAWLPVSVLSPEEMMLGQCLNQ